GSTKSDVALSANAGPYPAGLGCTLTFEGSSGLHPCGMSSHVRMSVQVVAVLGWTRWPNQDVEEPLSLSRPIAGPVGVKVFGKVAFAPATPKCVASASCRRELSLPERP